MGALLGLLGTGLVGAVTGVLKAAGFWLLIAEIARVVSWAVVIGAGKLFDLLVFYTITDFNGFYSLIQSGVEVAWSVFRDVSNILIIGLFTFIAISIILGIKEYGQKKFVARVLIVAVLINFSLLFAKIIVDASNFTALQVYVAAGNTVSRDAGMANEFLDIAHVSSFTDAASFSVIGDLFTGNVARAVINFVFGLLLMIGAALVLLYGSVLMLSRAILIVIVFVTSAAAFATYLLPAWQKSSYGWNKWWEALVKSAVLAPLLMFMMWMTLTVAGGVKSLSSSGSLGAAAAAPDNTDNITALLIYLFTLGLLYASFRVASSFSKKITGFNLSTALAISPLTLGSRFFAAPLSRAAIGGGAYAISKRLGKQAGEARDEAASLRQRARGVDRAAAIHRAHGNIGIANQASEEARRLRAEADERGKKAGRKLIWRAGAEKIADKKFNVMDTGVAKKAVETIGIKGLAAGASTKDTKSFAGQVKARAEEAEKIGAKGAPDREETEKQIRERRRDHRELLQAIRDSAKNNADSLLEQEQLMQKLTTVKSTAATVENDASKRKTGFDEQLRNGVITQAQHQSAMQQENARINKARDEVRTIEDRIKVIERPVRDAQEQIDQFEKETKAEIDTQFAAQAESAEKIVGEVGKRQGDSLTRALGALTGQNEAVSKEAVSNYKKKRGAERLQRVLENIQPGNAQTAANTQPPPTP